MAYDYGNRMFDDDTSKTPVAAVIEVAMDDDSKIDVQPKQMTETISESMQSSQITTTTTTSSIAAVTMQSSEEVNQINSALTHCTQLRTQLRGTLLYIQRLNSKYAHTDYMAVVRNLDNYRRQQQQQQQSSTSSAANSPYPKVRPRHNQHRSIDVNNKIGDDSNNSSSNKNTTNGNIISSTPVKRSSKMIRRRLVGRQQQQQPQGEEENGINNVTFTSTPKRTKFAQLDDAFEFGSGGYRSDINENGTPKRSVREMANQSNTISVCKIKVQRDIEATITHLQVMQKQQLKRRQQQLEQSLYQSCCSSNLSSFGSAASLAAAVAAASPRQFPARPQQQQQQHLLSNNSRYMEHSNASSYGTAYDSINNSMINSSSKFYTPPPPPSSSSKFNRSTSMQFDEGKRTLERVERCYVTPLQRMHKRLIHLNASLVRTC